MGGFPDPNPGKSDPPSLVLPNVLKNDGDPQFSVNVFMLTPIGASALYYCNQTEWEKLKDTLSNTPLEDGDDDGATRVVTRETVILSLLHSVCRLNERLHESALSLNPALRSIARSAFSSNPKSFTPTCGHGIFTHLLVDKLLWASLPLSKQDERPFQQPFLLNPPALHKAARAAFSTYMEWKTIVNTFVKDWEKCGEIWKAFGSGDEGGAECSGSADILSSLYRGTSEIATKLNINKIEYNFCMAALGLLGLMLVRSFFLEWFILLTLIFVAS